MQSISITSTYCFVSTCVCFKVTCDLLTRLICISTVEENILKKANQKQMLGNIAIEGGAFTTDFFKQVLLEKLILEECIVCAKL